MWISEPINRNTKNYLLTAATHKYSHLLIHSMYDRFLSECALMLTKSS